MREDRCRKLKLLTTHLSNMNRKSFKKEDLLQIYVDGAARGNPGPAASAFIFVRDGTITHENSEFIGSATNNTAEYRAIINALKAAERFSQGHLQVYSDSNLAIQQINKKWKINYPHLSELCAEVYKLSEKYERVEFFHVERNNPYIQKCDKLCNERLDAEGF
jgi:ribonuclease HI